MYWLPATGASSARLYWESFNIRNLDTVPAPAGGLDLPRRDLPLIPAMGREAVHRSPLLERARQRRPLRRLRAARQLRGRSPSLLPIGTLGRRLAVGQATRCAARQLRNATDSATVRYMIELTDAPPEVTPAGDASCAEVDVPAAVVLKPRDRLVPRRRCRPTSQGRHGRPPTWSMAATMSQPRRPNSSCRCWSRHVAPSHAEHFEETPHEGQ